MVSKPGFDVHLVYQYDAFSLEFWSFPKNFEMNCVSVKELNFDVIRVRVLTEGNW